MSDRIGRAIDWWCTGIAAAGILLVAFAAIFGTGTRGTVQMVAILFGVPSVLIFLTGKSIRFVLRNS